MGIQNDFGKQVSYKTKHTFTVQSGNHAPWYLSKKAEMSIQKSEHNVHSSFHNCQNLETTYMSFGR